MRYVFKLCSTKIILACCVLIASCSSTQSPVSIRTTIDRETEAERLGGPIITIVQSGDTWYGIAFENNLNVAELAAWNGMNSSDTLYSGQRIRLTKPPSFQASQSRPQLLDAPIVPESASESVPQASNSANVIANNNNNNTNTGTSSVIILNRSQGSEQAQVKSPVPPAQAPSAVISQSPEATSGFQQAVPRVFPKVVNWQWPIKGQIVSKYSPNSGRKGIDISAKQGQEIKVAAPGRVVYQGNGIRGYNNLIIIKHSEELLSAYAHNQQVFVREGQWVNADQTISTVGLKNGKPVLHFEIRKNGQSVNPLGYLGT